MNLPDIELGLLPDSLFRQMEPKRLAMLPDSLFRQMEPKRLAMLPEYMDGGEVRTKIRQHYPPSSLKDREPYPQGWIDKIKDNKCPRCGGWLYLEQDRDNAYQCCASCKRHYYQPEPKDNFKWSTVGIRQPRRRGGRRMRRRRLIVSKPLYTFFSKKLEMRSGLQDKGRWTLSIRFWIRNSNDRRGYGKGSNGSSMDDNGDGQRSREAGSVGFGNLR